MENKEYIIGFSKLPAERNVRVYDVNSFGIIMILKNLKNAPISLCGHNLINECFIYHIYITDS